MSFEIVLGSDLPPGARAPKWWANEGSEHTFSQRRAWGDAGFRAELIKGSATVRFLRATASRR